VVVQFRIKVAPRALPWGLLQPTFEPFTGAITHLLQLFAPVAGAPQEILTNAGSGQGQFIQFPERRGDLTRLLIHDPIGTQTPATAAGQPWITPAHEVVEDLTGGRYDSQISNAAQPFSVAIEQISLHQRGKTLKRGEVSLCRETFDKGLLLAEPAPLIKTPNRSSGAQR
jgi:hypothetical protein